LTGDIVPSGGLLWLDDRFAEQINFCLTFVGGSDEAGLFRAFGADPGEAVPRTRAEAEAADDDPALGYGPSVRVGRVGEWLFAWEESSWQGHRAEVLRRASAGGEAVAVANTLGAFAGFGYAAAGEVVTSMVTIPPYTRAGSDPDRFLPLVAEVGREWRDGVPAAAARPTDLQAVLTIAERAFGLAIGEEEVEQALPCARILPVLPDLPQPRPGPPGKPPQIWEPVINVLLAHADAGTVIAAVKAQARGVLADAGIDLGGALARAIDTAGADGPLPLADESPAGVELRLLMRESYVVDQEEVRRPQRRYFAPGEHRRMRDREHAANALHRLLAWGLLPGFPPVVIYRKESGGPGWREQLLRDLSGVAVPEAELREAEQQWQGKQGDGH
jgi:Family of unknown function (DUF6461)